MENVGNLLDINKLKNFINDNNIEEEVIKSFWLTFNNYQVEEPKEFIKTFGSDFCKDNLDVKIQTVSIKFGNWPNYNYNHIVVAMYIGYKKDNIGKYEVLFTFSGEIEDDYFTIY